MPVTCYRILALSGQPITAKSLKEWPGVRGVSISKERIEVVTSFIYRDGTPVRLQMAQTDDGFVIDDMGMTAERLRLANVTEHFAIRCGGIDRRVVLRGTTLVYRARVNTLLEAFHAIMVLGSVCGSMVRW